jgi:signal transduction histidine kinase
MIIGEGSVFLILLLFGFLQIRRALLREFELAKMEKTFLLSVTHELKTPIAAIKLFMETLKSRKLNAEQTSDIVHQTLSEAQRLQMLSENILLVTRLDQKNNSPLREKIDLTQLITQESSRLKNYGGKGERKIQVHSGEHAYCSGEPELIRALVNNLLENALKYSPPDSAIDISITHEVSELVLQLSDLGIGIPEEERERIFEKFYRVGNEETRKHKGTGLGLYLARSIVKLHRGSIKVQPNIPKGTTFIVRLPHYTSHE